MLTNSVMIHNLILPINQQRLLWQCGVNPSIWELPGTETRPRNASGSGKQNKMTWELQGTAGERETGLCSVFIEQPERKAGWIQAHFIPACFSK